MLKRFEYVSRRTCSTVQTRMSQNEIESLASVIFDLFLNGDLERQQWAAAFHNGKNIEEAYEYQLDLMFNNKAITKGCITKFEKFRTTSCMFI